MHSLKYWSFGPEETERMLLAVPERSLIRRLVVRELAHAVWDTIY